MIGDRSEYLHPVSGKLVSGTMFHMRSAVWPGFHAFYKDGQTFRMYVGDGQKHTTRPYFPKLVSNVQEDEDDPVPSEEFEIKVVQEEAPKEDSE